MPNYYADRYNAFLAHAGEIYSYLTGSYMDGIENHLLDCGTGKIAVGPMQFIRILQYRKTESAQKDFALIAAAMRANLQYCNGLSAAFGYFILSNRGEYSIYLAMEGGPAGKFVPTIETSVPDISSVPGFIPAQELMQLASYGGIVCGEMVCQEIVVDKILSALHGLNGIIGLIAVPMAEAEILDYVDALAAIKQTTKFLLGNESLTDPHHPRKTNRRSYRFVPEIDVYLDQAIEYYRQPHESFWKTCLWFGCDCQEKAGHLGRSVAAVLNASGDRQAATRARSYLTTANPFQTATVSIPTADYSTVDYPLPETLRKPSLISYLSTVHLASLIQFPAHSVNGFEAIALEKDADSLHLFDRTRRRSGGPSIEIGKIAGTTAPYSIPVNDLTEHLLVTGATGAGKTNTVKTLIRGIYRSHIPLLIIEPSKKDYWHLASEMRDMNLYSFGRDAQLLAFNPLVPEDGILIGNHIDSLDYAFSGAFEMEPATRLGLHGLLVYTYEKFGWSAGDIACAARAQYPEIRDMLTFLPEFCRTKLPYGEEVRNNILGSLFNRLSSLNSGMVGEAMHAGSSVSGEALCSGTTLIELDDLSLDVKPFVAMLIMIKAEQYLRQRDAADSLQNVIVLEEAHNVFAGPSTRQGQPAHQQSSRYFSNMLSQIREYGTGLIIVDQGVSQIDRTAVSNTKIKIIHGIVDGQDMEQVAFSLNLSDVQRRIFPQLGAGEAVVAVRGERSVSRVQIDRSENSAVQNVACVNCPSRFWCSRFNTAPDTDHPRRSLYARQIYEKRNSPQALRGEVLSIARHFGLPPSQARCFLGGLLADGRIPCSEREKRRIVSAYGQ